MKSLIYGLLLVLSSILAYAENRSSPPSPSELLPVGECSECEREPNSNKAIFGGLRPSLEGTGSSVPSSVSSNDKESALVDSLRLSRTTAKDSLNLARMKVTDENDIWLLESTLRALETAQIRLESSTEDMALSCDKDENGFVQFGYPHEIFVCNRFINFFPDPNERTVALAQLLIHEATHLAEIDDRTRVKGTPEGCRATYVEILATEFTSRNHKPVYRTYDMDRCEKEEQD
jgi:hypothetical protein